MTCARPLIGISPRQETRATGEEALVVQRSITDAILTSGGIPLLLGAPADSAALARFVEACDGFVIPGGSDIAPARYGCEPHAVCGAACELRDDFELELIPLVVAAGKPLLGICRGCQALNVALGGTLWQDLPSQPDARPTAVEEAPLVHNQGQPFSATVHGVEVTGPSMLSQALGLGETGGAIPVNSLHHQSVRTVAPGLTVTAWSPDGVVEGIELPGTTFVVGVQWHPEFLWRDDPRQLSLFEALVQAARKG